MRKRACNNINALKKRFFLATILLTGLFILPKPTVAQEATSAMPYWQINLKRQSYKLGLNVAIDTITITKKQQKASICITYKNENTSTELAGKKTIILMTTARQEIGRYELVNNSVTILLSTIVTASNSQSLVSINVVQQPSNSLLAKRARVGTKLLCYLKW